MLMLMLMMMILMMMLMHVSHCLQGSINYHREQLRRLSTLRFRDHEDEHADDDDSDDDADACFITFKSPLVQEQLRPQWCDKFGWRDNWSLTRFLVHKMMPSKPCHMNRFPMQMP